MSFGRLVVGPYIVQTVASESSAIALWMYCIAGNLVPRRTAQLGIIFVDALSTSFESPNFTVICGFSEVWKHCGPKLFWLKENISSRYGLMELQRCHVSFSFTTPSNSPENLAAQFAVTCVHKEYHNLANSESNWSESESEKCQILCHSFFKYLAHIMANKGRCSLVIACRVMFRYH